jgi:Family of unknown function (DUF5677)
MATGPTTGPLALNFGHQADVTTHLLEFGKEMLSGTFHSETPFVRKDLIFFALADKSLLTAEAIYILTNRMLVDDAFALIRVLIEGVVNGTYVLQMNDQTANDYADFPDFRDWIEFNQLQAVAPEITNATLTEDVVKMRSKWESVRSRYENNGTNGQDWCSINLFRRASETDKVVGQPFKEMRTLVNLPWRKACIYVHGTAASIQSRVQATGSEITIHRRFETKDAASVLYMSNRAIFTLLAHVDIRLGKARAERWKMLYAFWRGDPSSSTEG